MVVNFRNPLKPGNTSATTGAEEAAWPAGSASAGTNASVEPSGTEATLMVVGPLARQAARPVEARHFLILTGPDGEKRWIIIGQAPLTIGRGPPSDIIVADRTTSSTHCRIEVVEDHVCLTDLNSTNGTFLAGERITAPTRLRSGTAFSIGMQSIGYERRLRDDFEEMEALDRDLRTASRYVQMLLPRPIVDGPFLADWHFLPCARVGGDAFNYGPIGNGLWGGFICDVTGHGAGAALHAVTILNVLRRAAIPGGDLSDPGIVVKSLNDMFQADVNEVPLFSIWGFTYDPASRALRYCSGGHHPAMLVTGEGGPPEDLNTRNPLVGMIPGREFISDVRHLPPSSTLYLFSDGAFEIETAEGKQLTLQDFKSLLGGPPRQPAGEPLRIYKQVRSWAKPGPLPDDLSVVTLHFP